MRSHRYIGPIACAFALAACTSATIDAAWRSPSAPMLTSVVAISPAPDGAIRRASEDKLAFQLRRHGVRAVPAYAVLSDQDLQDQDRIRSTARARGFDGIVAIRLVSAEQQLAYYPGFDAYWGGTWGNVYPQTIVRVEINAYSLQTNQLVWSVMSKSTDPNSANQVMKDTTKLAGDKLAADGIIGAPQMAVR